MSVKNVVVLGSDVLRKKSKPVVDFDENLGKLLDDMTTTMVESNGVGIAAVQVGVLRRAIVIELEEGKYLELVNPTIIETKGKTTQEEGCLSVPGFRCEVSRPKYVKVAAFDRHGKPFEFEVCDKSQNDFLARCVCHEIDHLDGVLFVDLTDEGKAYKTQRGVK